LERRQYTVRIMEQNRESFFTEMIRFALITLAIVIPIRLFLAEPFIVSGASMEPTFDTGDYLLVDKLSYHFEGPKRGDVVIFRYPKDPSTYFIKRIVGLPGDTVRINDGKVTIVDAAHPEGFTLNQSFLSFVSSDSGTYVIGNDEYFVMGDNRPASSDSRTWGELPAKNIVGRAMLRLFPPKEIGVLPGNHRTTENN
jgi:signal peptidase I